MNGSLKPKPILAFMAVALAVMMVATVVVIKFLPIAARASSNQMVTIGMPFTGQWAYNALVIHPYTDSNSSWPGVHATDGGGDWATDLYRPAGTTVKLWLNNPTGTMTLRLRNTWTSSCAGAGSGIAINVYISGVNIGWVSYAHLDNINKSGPFVNGMTLGVVTYGSLSSCYSAHHTHLEVKNTTAYSCWVDNGQPGVTLNEQAAVGVLGATNTGVKQSCTSQTTGNQLGTPSNGGSTRPVSISFNGALNIFKIGGDGNVYQDYWNGSSWSGFSSMGGTFLSNPAVIVNGSALNIFERGQDGQIYTEYNSGSGWSGWTSLGTHQMKGNPTVMFYGTSMNVFALDTNNVPYEDTWTANGWTGWNSNGNYMGSDPVAVSYGGNLHLIYRGGDNKPYENVFNGSTWTGFGEIGQGSVIGNPTALSYGAEGELDVYFSTPNNQIWKNTDQGSGWGTWTEMATGGFTGDPYISTYGNDLQVYARDTSNNIETRYWSYSGQSWSGWSSLGGSSNSLASDPFALQYGSSELDVFATGTDGKTYKDTFNPTNGWGGFSVLN